MSSNQQISRLKADTICRRIREEIVSGRRVAGSQLDTWDDMESAFGVGRATLMRALGQLKRDGFIFADSTRGTFVSDRPPHLTRYAMAFQGRPGGETLLGWNRFWRALYGVATDIAASGEKTIPVFYDINGHLDEPEQKRLLDEVLRDRLAGVIFVGPIESMSVRVMQMSGLPKVAISSVPEDANYPRIYIDYESFVTKACDYLAARNRRRVAVLAGHDDYFFNHFAQAIVARGMKTLPQWQLPFDVIRPNAAFAATRLLLDRGNVQRPDALVICDDNMVESAMAAIVDAGIKVPDELEVVTHCNWQERWPTVLPTKRLGYDARAVLLEAIKQIDLQRQNKAPSKWTGVPAQFEEELS